MDTVGKPSLAVGTAFGFLRIHSEELLQQIWIRIWVTLLGEQHQLEHVLGRLHLLCKEGRALLEQHLRDIWEDVPTLGSGCSKQEVL